MTAAACRPAFAVSEMMKRPKEDERGKTKVEPRCASRVGCMQQGVWKGLGALARPAVMLGQPLRGRKRLAGLCGCRALMNKVVK